MRFRNKALSGAALAAALAFLIQHEGSEQQAYQDSAGVWTICSGSTKGVQPGQTASQEQCWDMTTRDYRVAESAVLRAVHVPLRDHQIVALSSFCYNVGNSACQSSTLFRRLNAGEGCRAAIEELPRWNKITLNGQKVSLRGLTNRRQAEVSLFTRNC